MSAHEPSHAKERGVYHGDVKTLVTPTNETVHLKHGHGTYTFPNKFFKYTGAWVNGKMSGRGLLQMGDGSSYEGPFVDGEMMGIGVRRWANGSTYWGSVFQGHMHGEGRFMGANRVSYEGSFHLNQRQGVCACVCVYRVRVACIQMQCFLLLASLVPVLRSWPYAAGKWRRV